MRDARGSVGGKIHRRPGSVHIEFRRPPILVLPHEQAPDQQPPLVGEQPQLGLGGPAAVLVVRPGVEDPGLPRHHPYPERDFATRCAMDHRVRKAGGIAGARLPGGQLAATGPGRRVPGLRERHRVRRLRHRR
ncbi:hypothetical protein ACIPWI_12565 [Streptomyces sp. NPDC090046]|uniref:hypothetical protein n=1 Tax=Streptomyces sp. NPDC090046 TaxID=3365928 RepID=UPI0038169FFA